MARQFKQGLDYFPFDTGFFSNDKIQLIEAEFGNKGVIVALRLLCKIYNNGYYTRWGEDECLLFSKAAGAEFVPATVNEIVLGLVRRRFFDKGCFDMFQILTSTTIQEIYFEASERRKYIELTSEYLLIPIPKNINAVINSINVNINPINENKSTQIKGKEIKGKEIKEKERERENSETAKQFTPPSIEDVQSFISEKEYSVNAKSFISFYTSKNWYIGENKMRDWKAAIVTWEERPNSDFKKDPHPFVAHNINKKKYGEY